MDPVTILNLALAALQGLLQLISTIKSQSGLSDDAILAQAQTLTGANTAAYNALVAALSVPLPATPPAAPPAASA